MIQFYGGPFSNFIPTPIELDGALWPTVEHYFQAQKTTDPVAREQIRTAPGPWEAKALGRSVALRPEWEEIKEAVMMAGLRAKFARYPGLATVLLQTGSEEIVEHTPRGAHADHYWGDGGDGTGKNRLGVLLMRLRAEIAAGGPAAN